MTDLAGREALIATGVTYSFPNEHPVLDDVTFSARFGEFVAITGPSGSGKSTLLLCLAGILAPTQGAITVAGTPMQGSSDDRAAVRRQHLGLVFQFSDLVAELSLEENVALPLELLGHHRKSARKVARELLGELGMASLGTRFPGQVSGGQAQRAAVARALVHKPSVVLADEPTGALDADNAATVLDLLSGLARSHGSALIVVTHDRSVAARADRVVKTSDFSHRSAHGEERDATTVGSSPAGLDERVLP